MALLVWAQVATWDAISEAFDWGNCSMFPPRLWHDSNRRLLAWGPTSYLWATSAIIKTSRMFPTENFLRNLPSESQFFILRIAKFHRILPALAKNPLDLLFCYETGWLVHLKQKLHELVASCWYWRAFLRLLLIDLASACFSSIAALTMVYWKSRISHFFKILVKLILNLCK